MSHAQLFNALNGAVFLVALLCGSLVTVSRVIYYYRNRLERPRLLTRDLVVIGGVAWTAALLVISRVAQVFGLDTSGLRESLLWAVATGVPASVAALTYTYYEVFVIERRSTGWFFQWRLRDKSPRRERQQNERAGDS